MLATGTFILFIVLFLSVGFVSASKAKKTLSDYHVASKESSFWTVALSVFASYQSAYIFLGAIGYIFFQGLSGIWLIMGAWVGELCALAFAIRRFRSAAGESLTYGNFLSQNLGAGKFKTFPKISAVIIVILMTAYITAQLIAGSKAMASLFHFPFEIGVLLTGALVLLYCIFGGMRATLWTDILQGSLMWGLAALLAVMAYSSAGGWSAIMQSLDSAAKSTDWFPSMGLLGGGLFILGWAAGGFALLGQPHVMSRVLTLKNPSEAPKVVITYVLLKASMNIFLAVIALAANAVLINHGEALSADRELVFPLMVQELFPGVLIGLAYAALFSSILSTVDSQVLAASGAITLDLIPKRLQSYRLSRVMVLTVLIGATLMAVILPANSSIFVLSIKAFGIYGAAFTPLVVAILLGYRALESIVIVSMVASVATFLFFPLIRSSLGLGYFFELLPAIVVGLGVLALGRVIQSRLPLSQVPTNPS